MTRPMPSLPWRTWCRWPTESRQSSPNKALNRRLKVSCGTSPSAVFMTDQILSSLEPFGMASNKEHDRLLMSLMSCLTVSRVHIFTKEREGRGEGAIVCVVEAKRAGNVATSVGQRQAQGRHKYLGGMASWLCIGLCDKENRLKL